MLYKASTILLKAVEELSSQAQKGINFLFIDALGVNEIAGLLDVCMDVRYRMKKNKFKIARRDGAPQGSLVGLRGLALSYRM